MLTRVQLDRCYLKHDQNQIQNLLCHYVCLYRKVDVSQFCLMFVRLRFQLT